MGVERCCRWSFLPLRLWGALDLGMAQIRSNLLFAWIPAAHFARGGHILKNT